LTSFIDSRVNAWLILPLCFQVCLGQLILFIQIHNLPLGGGAVVESALTTGTERPAALSLARPSRAGLGLLGYRKTRSDNALA